MVTKDLAPPLVQSGRNGIEEETGLDIHKDMAAAKETSFDKETRAELEELGRAWSWDVFEELWWH
jgi:hypothetical protein